METDNLKNYMLEVKKLVNDTYKMGQYKSHYEYLVNSSQRELSNLDSQYRWNGNPPEKREVKDKTGYVIEELIANVPVSLFLGVVAAVICWFLTHNFNYCVTTFGIATIIFEVVNIPNGLSYDFYVNNTYKFNDQVDNYIKWNENLIVASKALSNVNFEAMQIAEQRLQELYNKDIIYGKYRNFIAINQMCEYLESGRCA